MDAQMTGYVTGIFLSKLMDIQHVRWCLSLYLGAYLLHIMTISITHTTHYQIFQQDKGTLSTSPARTHAAEMRFSRTVA
jgi:hypothetical protein